MAWNPTYVQTDTGVVGGSGPPIYTKVFVGNVTAGNILVTVIGSTLATPAVTDSQGNTWTNHRQQTGASRTVSIWTAFASSTGACTVTLDVVSGTGLFKLYEFTPDGATSVAMDVGNGSYNTGTPTHAAGSVTPTVNDTWAIFGASIVGGFFVSSGPTSYNVHGSTSGEPLLYDRIMASPVTHNPTLTTSTNETTAVEVVVLAQGAAAAAGKTQAIIIGG